MYRITMSSKCAHNEIFNILQFGTETGQLTFQFGTQNLRSDCKQKKSPKIFSLKF
jgi:hypothetical protein